MALVDGGDSGIGYGQAPKPAPAQPFWDDTIGTYRDPMSGRVAVGSDAAGWRWISEWEYRTMFTGKQEDWGNVPDIMRGARDTLAYSDPVSARSGQAYPVANPFAGHGRVSADVQPTGRADIEDRRYSTPIPTPIPAPAPTPAPSLQVIGGQIVRFPR